MRKSMCLAFRNAGGFRIIWESARISRNETASTCSSLGYLRWFTDKNVLIYCGQGEYVVQIYSPVSRFCEKDILGVGAYRYTHHQCNGMQLRMKYSSGKCALSCEHSLYLLLANLNSDLFTHHWRKRKIAREYIYLHWNCMDNSMPNTGHREFLKEFNSLGKCNSYVFIFTNAYIP